jgi:hypothetical protein
MGGGPGRKSVRFGHSGQLVLKSQFQTHHVGPRFAAWPDGGDRIGGALGLKYRTPLKWSEVCSVFAMCISGAVTQAVRNRKDPNVKNRIIRPSLIFFTIFMLTPNQIY